MFGQQVTTEGDDDNDEGTRVITGYNILMGGLTFDRPEIEDSVVGNRGFGATLINYQYVGIAHTKVVWDSVHIHRS